MGFLKKKQKNEPAVPTPEQTNESAVTEENMQQDNNQDGQVVQEEQAVQPESVSTPEPNKSSDKKAEKKAKKEKKKKKGKKGEPEPEPVVEKAPEPPRPPMSRDEKLKAIKENNMFYYMSFRTTKKQVTGFSFRLVRYDVTEKIFRSSSIVEELYKPKLFQRKENYTKNGINHKVFKKMYSGASDMTGKAKLIYDVVNRPNNIVLCTPIDDMCRAFLKKKLPQLQIDNIKEIEFVGISTKNALGSGLGSDFCKVEEVFADIRAFKKFLSEAL